MDVHKAIGSLSLSELAKVDEQAAQLLLGVYAGARKSVETDGECQPLVLVFPKSTIVPEGVLQPCIPLPVGPLMNSGDGKDNVRRLIDKLLEDAQTQAVAFVSEAWMVVQSTPDTDVKGALASAYRGESLAKHPDRVETVIVSLFRPGKPAVVAQAPLTHKPDRVGEPKIMPNDGLTGRFTTDAGGLDQTQH